MEQKLRSALSPRAAWILIGACIIFWIVSAFGLLQLPASAPSLLMFFWLYLNALAALASAVAVAAAVAALVLHRRVSRHLEPEGAGGAPPSALDAAEETDLNRLLNEEPPNEPGTPAPSQPAPASAAESTRTSRRKRKRR
ncbi:hypothetical protein H9638_01495 [Arthrobacter sp. Sa2BUA2]|uniref:DUF1049 domain-containing protein n=1 Tax=Arthrobacter pullicola TaxID=2762224 RepID=A0ABR8YEC6_9MICC|nr:hypothetical protein [Arthrobacter pullicola]MBD8042477.1 hypothetical protein [Arthrobacter pullicola]